PGPSLMVAAHSDEIGCMVKSVEKNGYIRFEKVGGTIDSLLVGRQMCVNGHFGVVGVKAGHLMSEKERSEVKKHTELYIDVGVESAEEVKAMGIRVGDPITYWPDLQEFTNTDRICGKALDDRIGCAILLHIFTELKASDFAGTVYAVITVQEEVGLRGATVAAHRLNPDIAIALDTMPAGDTPDISTTKELPVLIGRGPVVQVMSGGGARGNILHPAMKRLLIGLAEEEGIPHQVAILPGGTTDASAIHLVREGILAAALTIPRRYSHSSVEVMDLNDAVNAKRMVETLIRRLGNVGDLSFLG
ncbi:MAG: M42 family metallopeptidase, partial [Bacillota bacterium]